jgi:hypothetical protein
VLASVLVSSIKNSEVPRAATGACLRVAAQEFGERPPAKPNFLLASAASADSLPTTGTRTARPPAKPNWLALSLPRLALSPPGCLTLSLPSTDDLLTLHSIQLLAPNNTITSRSQILRCCVVAMDNV